MLLIFGIGDYFTLFFKVYTCEGLSSSRDNGVWYIVVVSLLS
jgi:hypothetical protein